MIDTRLTSSGIDKTQVPWVDALAPVAAHEALQSRGSLVLDVRVHGREGSFASFDMPRSPGRLNIKILTLDGTVVRRLEPSGDAS